jgi:hypothetical protein
MWMKNLLFKGYHIWMIEWTHTWGKNCRYMLSKKNKIVGILNVNKSLITLNKKINLKTMFIYMYTLASV